MKRIVTATTLAALVLSACAVPARSAMPMADSKPVSTSTTIAGAGPSATRALMTFGACEDLLAWTTVHALQRVGPYGLDGYGGYPMYDDIFAVRGEGDVSLSEETTPTPAASAAQEKIDLIGTNLQEIGVDEPDIVKTDGNRIVAVNGSTLFIVSVDRDRLELRGSIDLAFRTQDLFLDGDRVIAIANGGFDPMPFVEESIELDVGVMAPQTAVLTVAEIDISDLDDPELARTLRIDGQYVSSRMVDGAVRLVVSSGPTGFVWSYPSGGGLRAERTAEERNREIIETSNVENWLPYFIVTDHKGRDSVVAEGTLLACHRTHRPEDFSGFTTLSLVTLGADELDIVDATGVFADGEIVYSSGAATYVATNQWTDPIVFEETGRPEGMKTMIHKFDLSNRGANYQASGAVSGYMLSQWSMSEHNGYLRVASTDTPEWWDGPDTESMVTVLDTQGDELRSVGLVDGLGRGERIYSVRFVGDKGYVVTFRQVDPLYVIDLSDPTRPAVRGELKIPGYSAYLHPIGSGALLGVGQDADLDGRVQGLQASLFDVSDPDEPARIDRFTMAGGHSEVEWDHHAFMHDPTSGLTVFPFERWSDRDGGAKPTGALVLTVNENGIRQAGEISHGKQGFDWWMPIRRSLMIDGRLVTISDAGIMVTDPRSLETLDWVAFGSS